MNKISNIQEDMLKLPQKPSIMNQISASMTDGTYVEAKASKILNTYSQNGDLFHLQCSQHGFIGRVFGDRNSTITRNKICS